MQLLTVIAHCACYCLELLALWYQVYVGVWVTAGWLNILKATWIWKGKLQQTYHMGPYRRKSHSKPLVSVVNVTFPFLIDLFPWWQIGYPSGFWLQFSPSMNMMMNIFRSDSEIQTMIGKNTCLAQSTTFFCTWGALGVTATHLEHLLQYMKTLLRSLHLLVPYV